MGRSQRPNGLSVEILCGPVFRYSVGQLRIYTDTLRARNTSSFDPRCICPPGVCYLFSASFHFQSVYSIFNVQKRLLSARASQEMSRQFTTGFGRDYICRRQTSPLLLGGSIFQYEKIFLLFQIFLAFHLPFLSSHPSPLHHLSPPSFPHLTSSILPFPSTLSSFFD